MILRNTDMKTFFQDIINGRDIVCFGAGKQFKEMLENFYEFPWKDKIVAVLDNDSEKWDTYIKISDDSYHVVYPSDFLNREKKNYVMLVCSSYYESILRQLDDVPSLKDIECYIYSLMACKSLHEVIPIKTEGDFLIPPVIHYCWFGRGAIPDEFRRCIDSWHKFCPDYDIVEWNEDDCDVTENEFVYEAYRNKKYAFVSDYFHLKIIYEHGGIYLDTDVELLRCLDDLRREEAFCGLERPGLAAFGLGFGAVKGNEIIYKLMQRYNDLRFKFSTDPDEKRKIVSPYLQTEDLLSMGMKLGNHWQRVGSMTIFPIEVLSPKHTGEVEITDYSYAMHHYAGSWLSPSQRIDVDAKLHTIKSLLSRVEYK